MLFSVIIPTYNCQTSLESTVKSICQSGLTDYEVWLVDDGSTDKTPAMCDALCSRYPEVHCVHQKNAGVSAARNCGIEHAHGEYLIFVDADDSLADGALTNAVEKIEENNPDLLIFGMRFDYYHKGKKYRSDELLPPVEGVINGQQLQEKFMSFYANNALSSACNKIFRRALLAEHQIRFRPGMILMEDFLFVLDVLPWCDTICCLREPIYQYRQCENERNAWKRLQKIADLGAYLRPFEESVHQLTFLGNERFIGEQVYKMLLEQKMYYASLTQLHRILEEHTRTSYASIKWGSPWRIYLKNRKIQLRHRVAVFIKSLL